MPNIDFRFLRLMKGFWFAALAVGTMMVGGCTEAVDFAPLPAGKAATIEGLAGGLTEFQQPLPFGGKASFKVSLLNGAGDGLKEVFTDTTGAYSFGNIAAGQYQLLVEAGGFVATKRKFAHAGNATLILEPTYVAKQSSTEPVVVTGSVAKIGIDTVCDIATEINYDATKRAPRGVLVYLSDDPAVSPTFYKTVTRVTITEGKQVLYQETAFNLRAKGVVGADGKTYFRVVGISGDNPIYGAQVDEATGKSIYPLSNTAVVPPVQGLFTKLP